jgi:hypothetical protein
MQASDNDEAMGLKRQESIMCHIYTHIFDKWSFLCSWSGINKRKPCKRKKMIDGGRTENKVR